MLLCNTRAEELQRSEESTQLTPEYQAQTPPFWPPSGLPKHHLSCLSHSHPHHPGCQRVAKPWTDLCWNSRSRFLHISSSQPRQAPLNIVIWIWLPNTSSNHEEHQIEPSAGLRAPLLRLSALLGHERDRMPSKKPSVQVDGAQPGLSQSELIPDWTLPWRHAAYLHRRLSQERHHTDARHAGCPQSCAMRGRDPSDSPPLGNADHLEPLSEGEDTIRRGRRHWPGAGLGCASFPVGGELVNAMCSVEFGPKHACASVSLLGYPRHGSASHDVFAYTGLWKSIVNILHQLRYLAEYAFRGAGNYLLD